MSEEAPSQQPGDSDVSENSGTKRSSPGTPMIRWITVILLGLVIVVAGVWFFLIRSGSEHTTRSLPKSRAPETVGGEVRLYIKDRDTVMVATDEKALDDLIAAMTARPDAVQDLIQAGKVFTVPNDTRARIVAIGFGKTKVRVIEGDKILSEGWVPESWVW